MILNPFAEIRGFKGINNVEDEIRIPPGKATAFLTAATNIDIDNSLMPHRRKGYGTAYHSGSGIHSLWANDIICLFVGGRDLKTFNADRSVSVIRADVGDAQMSYADVNGDVYFTNSSIIEYVKDGVAYPLAEPGQDYKTVMKAGQLIEWYSGRLYVARGNVLWYSDPMAPRRTDERRNFKMFPSRITVLRAVSDGIYVCAGSTYFLAGLSPVEMVLRELDDVGGIEGTDVLVDGLGSGDVPAWSGAMWLSSKGICLGMDGGGFKNITEGVYEYHDRDFGAAIARKTARGFWQYLASTRLQQADIDFGTGFSLTGSITAELSTT